MIFTWLIMFFVNLDRSAWDDCVRWLFWKWSGSAPISKSFITNDSFFWINSLNSISSCSVRGESWRQPVQLQTKRCRFLRKQFKSSTATSSGVWLSWSRIGSCWMRNTGQSTRMVLTSLMVRNVISTKFIKDGSRRKSALVAKKQSMWRRVGSSDLPVLFLSDANPKVSQWNRTRPQITIGSMPRSVSCWEKEKITRLNKAMLWNQCRNKQRSLGWFPSFWNFKRVRSNRWRLSTSLAIMSSNKIVMIWLLSPGPKFNASLFGQFGSDGIVSTNQPNRMFRCISIQFNSIW